MLIAAFLSSTSVFAAGENDIFARFKKPMPKVSAISEDEFIKTTKLIQKKPYGEDALAYSMRIDKTWREPEDRSSGNFILSEKLFQNLNVFYGKPTITGRSRIEVQALNIEGNLDAEQWYLKYILEGGYTTEGFITHDEQKVESLMVVMERDYSYYLRTLIVINGSKVIMVRYFVPVHYIQEQAAMQAQVLKSFKLLNKQKRVTEEMEAYRFLDVAEVGYPATWKVFPKPMRSADRMDVSLVSIKEVPGAYGQVASSTEGRVDVALLSSDANPSLVMQVDKYKKEIEASGMLVGEKIETPKNFEYHETINFGLTEVYRGIDSSSKISDYEVWFTVMVGGNYFYFVTLLTPSRNESFATWANNTQNYRAMIKGFTPMVGAFLERD